MLEGKVKWFNPEKGFGFITIKDSKKEMHFHVSNIKDKPPKGKNLTGFYMKFTEGKGKEGKPTAVNVEIQYEKTENGIKEINNKSFFLPKDTSCILNPEMVDNYYLKLNKLPFYAKESGKGKFKFYSTDKKGDVDYSCKPSFQGELFCGIKKKQENLIENLIKSGQAVYLYQFKADWRLIVGLGCESVYETSMLLHHIYGIPYIPGTAIKGVFRSYVIASLFNNSEDEALKDKGFRILFGDQGLKGKLFFHDAFPSEVPTVEPDVMTPHYSDYYTGNVLPADYLEPTIIPFLTVKDSSFHVYVAIKRYDNVEITKNDKDILNDEFENNTPLKIVERLLPQAFELKGIGAKTAVGYGTMARVIEPAFRKLISRSLLGSSPQALENK